MKINTVIHLITIAFCANIEKSFSAAVITEQDGLDYLKRFGYIDNDDADTVLGSAIYGEFKRKQALYAFQYMSNLIQTGEFDEDTLEMMRKPRCAVKDNYGYGTLAKRRRKRYTVLGSRWNTTALTYRFLNYTRQLSQQTNRNVVVKAFSLWSSVSPLSFREVTTTTAHIHIKYAAGWHGDSFPFDGRGGVLAHAFAPGDGGDAHFDEDEYWTDGINTGSNLLQVTTHEFGHSIGLGHSNEPGAMMSPYYGGYNPQISLSQDDINGIRFLYPVQQSVDTTTMRQTPGRAGATPGRTTPLPGGVQVTTTTTTTTQATTTTTTKRTTANGQPAQNVCNGAVIDAIVVDHETTYAFLGNQYYIFDDYGIRSGYPRPISEKWPQVSGGVDAALYVDPVMNGNAQVEPGYLYLCRADRCWKYVNTNQQTSDSPRLIREYFPGVPDYLDDAFVWSGNGQIYFIKGGQYYLFIKGQGVDQRYPRPMSDWYGVPSNINAAFRWVNGRTYFFSGTQYYRFNDIAFRTDSGYPRYTSEWWFGCSSTGFRMYPYNMKVPEYDEGLAGANRSTPGGNLHIEMQEGPAQFDSVGLNDRGVATRNLLSATICILSLFTSAYVWFYSSC